MGDVLELKKTHELRQYVYEDGSYVLMTVAQFSKLTEEEQKELTLTELIPTKEQIAEWDSYQNFQRLWHNTVDKLEETSQRPPIMEDDGETPRQWRYSTHDIANVLTWMAQAYSGRINALDEEIRQLKEGK
jgi:hypothetical protein